MSCRRRTGGGVRRSRRNMWSVPVLPGAGVSPTARSAARAVVMGGSVTVRCLLVRLTGSMRARAAGRGPADGKAHLPNEGGEQPAAVVFSVSRWDLVVCATTRRPRS